MNTIRRSALQDIWNATRVGFARLNQVLADAGDESDLVFHVRKEQRPVAAQGVRERAAERRKP